MWIYYPELLATPVPRYTSYPTAAEFDDGVGRVDHAVGLANVAADEDISLYLHIPYCREICWYCGCNTGTANRSHRLATYLERLGQEIDLVAARLDGRGKVARIAFGGGSPNAIAPEQFLALADKLRSRFNISADAVWSVELDPRGFDQPFADALAQVGVARASLGVQTFDSAIQQRIGRNQGEDIIARTSAMLRDAGVTSLNFDLMYGLPDQNEGALIDSLDTSMRLGADRLAVFGYAHVPHLIPRQRRIDASALPDAAGRFRMAAVAHDWLLERDWVAVGFDHYARPDDSLAHAARQGQVRRNFQGFTDDLCNTLIGLGATSISRFRNALIQNEKNAGRYGLLVGNGQLPGSRGIATPAQERRRGRTIEALLCTGQADLGALPHLAQLRSALSAFEQRKLIEWNGACLHLKPDAQPYARTIAATLDPWRQASAVRFSSAV